MNIELLKYYFSKSYRSFSQNGEDMLLNKFFQGKKKGFYIDVGSNHPVILSNTYFFYRRGWRGITIEANKKFNFSYKIFRPADIHLNEFVADEESECFYCIYKQHVFNRISKEELNDADIINKIKIKTKPFDKVVNPFLQNVTHFDFLSIDIEGGTINVLRTLPRLLILPEVILLEIEDFEINELLKTQEYSLLKELGYELFSIMFNNIFFKRINFTSSL